MVERIRRSAGFIPELSLVAESEGAIVGHLLLSKAEVVDGALSAETIVLAPIAVRPALQRSGIGKRLMAEGKARCSKLGYTHVFLIGHSTYYPKFGFRPARSHGFELKQFEVPDDVFMVCVLMPDAAESIRGELRYPKPFLELN